ncbi:tRNA pseudouridine(38-40) synthase TruA [Magnetococcales bacterium HHB-1]
MPRFRLTLAYDGQPFCGWQRQKNGPSIQEALEFALQKIAGRPITVMGAGRTDSGVHALAQEAHFDLQTDLSPETLGRALNALTARSIMISEIKAVDRSFHACRSAIGRYYTYKIDQSRHPSPFLQDRAWWFRYPLQIDRMAQAGQMLLGRHDFSAFRASSCQAKSPVKQIYALNIRKKGRVIEISVHGDAFLHHMVRNIVGSLVKVGRKEWSVAEFTAIFQGGDRTLAGPTAPATGLYLVAIAYPKPWNQQIWSLDDTLGTEITPPESL